MHPTINLGLLNFAIFGGFKLAFNMLGFFTFRSLYIYLYYFWFFSRIKNWKCDKNLTIIASTLSRSKKKKNDKTEF